MEGMDDTSRYLRNNFYHVNDKSIFVKVNVETLTKERRAIREFEKVKHFFKDLMDLNVSKENTIQTLVYDKASRRYVANHVDMILNTMTAMVSNELVDTKFIIRPVKPHITYLHENFHNVFYEMGCMVVKDNANKYKKKMSREHFNQLKQGLGVSPEDTYWKRGADERIVAPRLIETDAGWYLQAVEVSTGDIVVEKQYIGFGKFAVMVPASPVMNSTTWIHTPQHQQLFKIKIWDENCVHRIYEYSIEWDSGKFEL